MNLLSHIKKRLLLTDELNKIDIKFELKDYGRNNNLIL